MDQTEAINKTRQYKQQLLQADFGVEKMFLFGSYATGNERLDSDIDVAIVRCE